MPNNTLPEIPCATNRATAYSVAITLLVAASVFLMALKPVRSPDVWHHIKSGWLVAQQGHPARQEVFSATAQGREWIQFEWLSQLVLYGIAQGGPTALVLVRAAAAAIAAVLLLLTCRVRGARWPAGALAVGMAMCAASGRFFTRPEIFTWVVLAAFLLCVEHLRRGRWAFLPFIPLLMALWVNLHGAWPAGLAWLGLACGGETLRLWLKRPDPPSRRVLALLWGAFGLALAATLANPYGWRIWEVPLTLSQTAEVRQNIAEWQRPDWAHWTDPTHLGAWIFLLALALAPRRVRLPDALVLVFFAALALGARRHLSLAMVMAAPIIAVQFSALWETVVSYIRRPIRPLPPWARGAITALLLACLVWLALGLRLQRLGIHVEERLYPIGAARFLEAHALDGNLFNSYMYGNYLLYARYPRNLVFIDGRVDMYGAEVVRLYNRVRTASEDWRAILAQHGIDLAVFDLTRTTELPLMRAMHEAPDWALVYWDTNAAIYVQRGPRREDFLRGRHIYSIWPKEFEPERITSRDEAVRAEADYRAKLREDADSVPALYALARLVAMRGERREAIGYLRRATALDPKAPTPHYILGTLLLQEGDMEGARVELTETLRLGAHQAQAWLALSVVHHKGGDLNAAIHAARRALRFSEDNWMIHWNLSQLLEQQGDLRGAARAVREVLRLQPKMEKAQERLRMLEEKNHSGGKR